MNLSQHLPAAQAITMEGSQNLASIPRVGHRQGTHVPVLTWQQSQERSGGRHPSCHTPWPTAYPLCASYTVL